MVVTLEDRLSVVEDAVSVVLVPDASETAVDSDMLVQDFSRDIIK